ncbi:MAG TPA: GNAT family N-acetyltransferase [Pseudoxanthomonas sp.]|nr:GNAT family N-acetyltransferase [Pseudoxanthomonas sp.]
MSIAVGRASPADTGRLAPLFDRYRVFYGQPSDPVRARAFLDERLRRGESVVLLAELDGQALGFTQLFPSFSSVFTARTWILNDLYVEAAARRRGVGAALLGAAAGFARDTGALRLELETGHDNQAAQALYRRLGWRAYEGTSRFRLPLPERA